MAASPTSIMGRYAIGGQIAAGGMATVHVGVVKGAAGFSRVVALKRMHPHFAVEPGFALMFVDEARLAARVRHPNVVPTLDVVMEGSELCIVMEYVSGVTVAQIVRTLVAERVRMPPPIALAILRDVLLGLHAAHEAADDEGRPLGIIHRDVSPQNVLVGIDGSARLLDFGIAKANVRLHETRAGDTLKGKLRYMAPEQLHGGPASQKSDVFAASIVLWEALTGDRLYDGEHEGEIIGKVLRAEVRAPSTVAPELTAEIDALVLRGLARAPEDRFPSAHAMAAAISGLDPAPAHAVGEWLAGVVPDALAERAELVRSFSRGAPAGDVVASPSGEATRTAVAAAATVDVDVPGPAMPTPAPKRFRLRLALAALGLLACAIALGARARAANPEPARSTEHVASPLAPSADVAPAPAPVEPPRATPSAAPRTPVRSAPARPIRRAPQTLPDHL